MALIINQKPYYGSSATSIGLPVGQQIIFSVIDTNVLANYFNVKYSAEVFVYNTSLGLSIGTFETTPNNAGAGIWDFRPILESFVSADNLGVPSPTTALATRYKTDEVPNTPIHLIDRYSKSANSLKRLAIVFRVYGSVTPTDPILQIGGGTGTGQYSFFNGVLQYDDVLRLTNNDYGFDLEAAGLYTAMTQGKFLSNAPTTQYANIDDYGVFAFLNFMPVATSSFGIQYITFRYYSSAGIQQGAAETILQPFNLGGADSQFLYAGVFPGNLRGWSSAFRAFIIAHPDGYYTIQANTYQPYYSALYTIQLNCPTNLGYTPIRLTWLNQWGAWDYYTFTQKSVKSISTKKAPYTQISGTWNETTLGISGYQGGRKNFRVNTSEKIKMNTPYVTEEEGHWFEELINSPEVYILNGYETESAPYDSITNKYVEPVTLTTSSFTRKTIANDKLMQYTIEVEKSKNRRTQSV